MTNGNGGILPVERVRTGVEALDEILGGGFLKNSLNIVMGHPGTGKTVLAQQLAFANADGDRPVLYITTLSEPLPKLVTYLQQLTFYDDARLLDKIRYEDLGAQLSDAGPARLVEYVREAIREIQPSIIIVDSYKAIHDLATSVAEMRRVTADLAGVVAAFETTTFLVGEYDEQDIPRYPEFAVADGIIEFARRSNAKRDERFLRVLKLRGSSYAQGFHAFTLSSAGLEVYPRLVSPKRTPEYRPGGDRVSTGNSGLDELLDGGLWRGSMTLVKGVAGTGKTTLALQFAMQAVNDGESSLYVNFQENPVQLGRTVRALGADMDDMTERGLHAIYMSPVELPIDRIVVDIFEMIRGRNVRRVVIDALGDIASAADDPHRFHDYMYALTQHLIAHDVTAMLTFESTGEMSARADTIDSRFSSIADCLIELGLDMKGPPRRTLRVAKARGIGHDLRLHEMSIRPGGIEIGPAMEPR